MEIAYQGVDTLDQKEIIEDELITHVIEDNEAVEIETADYAQYRYQYYGSSHVNRNLLRYEWDANDNRTEYIYDANNLLVTIKEPNDAGTSYHIKSSYTYDLAGRLSSSTDAVGRLTEYNTTKETD